MCVCGTFAICFEFMVSAEKQLVREFLEEQTQKRFVSNPEPMFTHTHTHTHTCAHTRTHALSYAFTDVSATIRKL